MKSFRRLLTLLLIAALAGWMGGFMSFTRNIREYPEPVIDSAMPPADAIVALTGGSERLGVGLELLKAGKGRKLFISGVHPNLTPSQIFGKELPPELSDCCVTLGYTADNTIGNATETLEWMQSQGFHSLRLVTSYYHMPRSLFVFREIAPDITIIPHPVKAESTKLSTLAIEYTKYVAERLRKLLRD